MKTDHTFLSSNGYYTCSCGFQSEELEMAQHMMQKLFPHIDADIEYEIGYQRKVDAARNKRKDDEIKMLKERLKRLES